MMASRIDPARSRRHARHSFIRWPRTRDRWLERDNSARLSIGQDGEIVRPIEPCVPQLADAGLHHREKFLAELVIQAGMDKLAQGGSARVGGQERFCVAPL